MSLWLPLWNITATTRDGQDADARDAWDAGWPGCRDGLYYVPGRSKLTFGLLKKSFNR